MAYLVNGAKGRSWIILFSLWLLPACSNFGGIGSASSQSCANYIFKADKQQFVNNQGGVVSCSIADNNKIFQYFPGKGCDYWKQFLGGDETITFTEVPILTPGSAGAKAQIYCIKQRYLELDHSGQVLLIDKGLFCLKESSGQKKEYTFASCDGVYLKNKDVKSNTTPPTQNE